MATEGKKPPSTVGEIISDLAAEMQRAREAERQRRAAMPPAELAALEARERRHVETRRREAEARRQEKEERAYQKYKSGFLEWLARDWWTVQEFVNLLHGDAPGFDPFLVYTDDRRRTDETVERCLGESLATKTEQGFLSTTVYVRARDCLGWPERRIDPDPYWRRAIAETQGSRTNDSTADTSRVDHEGTRRRPRGTAEGSPERPQGIPRGSLQDLRRHSSTAKASEGKQAGIKRRKDLLGEFLNQVDSRAAANHYGWNRESVPVTKRDFCRAFYRFASRQGAKIPKVGEKAIAAEARALGAGFQHGTKHTANNVLDRLFLDRNSA